MSTKETLGVSQRCRLLHFTHKRVHTRGTQGIVSRFLMKKNDIIGYLQGALEW